MTESTAIHVAPVATSMLPAPVCMPASGPASPANNPRNTAPKAIGSSDTTYPTYRYTPYADPAHPPDPALADTLAMIELVSQYASLSDKKVARDAMKILVDIAMYRQAPVAAHAAEIKLVDHYAMQGGRHRRRDLYNRLFGWHRRFTRGTIGRRSSYPDAFAMPATLLHIAAQRSWRDSSEERWCSLWRGDDATWSHQLLGKLTGRPSFACALAGPQSTISNEQVKTAIALTPCCLRQIISLEDDFVSKKAVAQLGALVAMAQRQKGAVALVRYEHNYMLLIAEKTELSPNCKLVLLNTALRLDGEAQAELESMPVDARTAALRQKLWYESHDRVREQTRFRLGLDNAMYPDSPVVRYSVRDGIYQEDRASDIVLLAAVMGVIQEELDSGRAKVLDTIQRISEFYWRATENERDAILIAQRAKMFGDRIEVDTGSRFVPTSMHRRIGPMATGPDMSMTDLINGETLQTRL